MVVFAIYLNYTIINTALPYLQKAFSTPVLTLQWVINIFALIFSAFLITSGRIADIIGRKVVFYYGIPVFFIGSLLAGLSINISMLIISRGIQALGTVVIVTSSLSLLSNIFTKDEYHKAVGIYVAISGVGLTLGPFVGGIIINWFNWRGVFFVNLPFLILGFLFCIANLTKIKTQIQSSKIDWLGVVFLTLSIGSFIYALIYGAQYNWDSAQCIGFFALSMFSIIILLFIERFASDPILNLKIFQNKQVQLAILICISAGVIVGALLFFNPLYLSIIRGQTPTEIGLSLAMIPFMQVVISFLYKKLYLYIGFPTLCCIAIFSALSATIIQYGFTENSSYFLIALSYILAGITWGFANISAPFAIDEAYLRRHSGATIGTIYTAWNISSSVLLATATVIFNARETHVLNSNLVKLGLHLNNLQHNHIKSTLIDPEHTKSILEKISTLDATKIFPLYKQSFIAGFHSMIISMSTIIAILLTISLYSAYRKKPSK